MTDELGPPAWVVKILVGLAFLVVLVVGVVLVIFTVRTTDVASQTRDLVITTQRAQARTDCRSEYNSARQEVQDRAIAISRQANIDFAGYLLGRPDSTEAVLLQDRADLVAANDAVLALPSLPDMVDKGYQLPGGMKHPPCPVVK